MTIDYDIIIHRGMIFEGSGNPWFRADIGIKDGCIEHIGKLDGANASQTIDAKELAVVPGFIDMHSHSDIKLLIERKAKPKIMQGVTTELLGQDGISCAPLTNEQVKVSMKKRLAGLLGIIDREWSWNTFGEYLDTLERSSPAINVASLVPHGSIRVSVMKYEDRAPTQDELETMKQLLVNSLEDGGFGMSTGLIYPPCSFAKSDELVELCKVVAEHNGIFVTHIRNESDYLLESLREMIEVSKKSGTPLHISHFKAAGQNNWPKAKTALILIDEARKQGLDMTFDQYPYIAGSTMLDSIIPNWAYRGGSDQLLKRLQNPIDREKIKENWDESDKISGWDNTVRWSGWGGIVITWVQSEKNKPFEGKSIIEIAKSVGKDPTDAALDLLVEEELAVSSIQYWGQEKDVAMVLKHEAQMVGTDGLLSGKPHPRVYGTYPRILGKFVREDNVISLREAIRKMTAFPAQRLGLQDRGILRKGLVADINIFDPDIVIDRATYRNPIQFPDGIKYVLVNGVIVNYKGHHTGKYPGAVLRHHV